ncbi:hypothetical protein Goklo_006283, partial [Gossypium klotzschianum]|nr:hypothetical protein [Gossypium klotzschianum]
VDDIEVLPDDVTINRERKYPKIRFSSRVHDLIDKCMEKVLACVRFPGLPYRYYTKGIFQTLVSEVRRIVKIDYNTIGGRKGKFTRMAIFVYLNKPLVHYIDIDGFTQKIEYEGLLQICYDSGSMVMASSNKASEDKEGLYGPWMVANTRRMRFLTTQFLVVSEIT